jgi:hypothetical protein
MKKYRVLVFKDQGRLSGERQAAADTWKLLPSKKKRQFRKLGNSAEISMDFPWIFGFSMDFPWFDCQKV